MPDRTIRIPMTSDVLISRCASCGVQYGVTAEFDEDRRNDGKAFYCPNGHTLSYGETEVDRIRRERDRLKQSLAEIDQSRAAAWNRAKEETAKREKVEKELKRQQRRVNAGVCPCCNRSFVALARHMQVKHPDVPYVPTVVKPKGRVRA